MRSAAICVSALTQIAAGFLTVWSPVPAIKVLPREDLLEEPIASVPMVEAPSAPVLAEVG